MDVRVFFYYFGLHIDQLKEKYKDGMYVQNNKYRNNWSIVFRYTYCVAAYNLEDLVILVDGHVD